MKKLLVLIAFVIACGDGRLSPQGGTITGATTGGGLVVTSGKLGLVTSCNDTEVLSWNSGTSQWGCAAVSGAVPDADYGDITVSSSGTVWTVDPGAVAYSELSGAFTTLNTVPKGNGTGLTASSLTDDGTTLATTDQMSIGSSSSAAGRLSVVSSDAGAGFGSLGSSWDTKYSVFGPNANTSGGAALGIGYSTTDDAANIASVAPGSAWKKMRFNASDYAWLIGSGNGCTLDASSVLNCVGGLQVNGTSVATTSNISGTSGTIPKFTGTNTVGNSILTESGSTVDISGNLTGGVAAGSFGIAASATSNGNVTIAPNGVGGRLYLNYGGTSGNGGVLIYDGGTVTEVAHITSAGNAQFNGTLQVNGNTTLGDSSTDVTTIYGTQTTWAAAASHDLALVGSSLNTGHIIYTDASQSMQFGTINTKPLALDTTGVYVGDTGVSSTADNFDVLTIGNTGTGQTGVDKSLVTATNSGSYNTTAVGLTSFGFRSIMQQSRSSGSNDLSPIGFDAVVSGGAGTNSQAYGLRSNVTSVTGNANFGVYSSASGSSGGNYSFYGAAGTLLNVGNAQVNGNTTLGDANTDTVTITASSMSITASSADTQPHIINTAAGGRDYILGVGSNGSGIPNSFYIWDNTSGTARIRLQATATTIGAAVGDSATVNGNLTVGTNTTNVHNFTGFTAWTSSGTLNEKTGISIANQSWNLGIASSQDNNGNASIMHDAYAVFSTTTTPTYKWNNTHGSFGSRGIEFNFSNGISFFADNAASTAGTTFTPTERLRISNAGLVTDYGALTVNGNTTLGDATSDTTTIAGAATLSGSVTYNQISATLSASVNNWAPTGIANASTIDITSATAGWTITGIDATGTNSGRRLCINNRSGQTLVLSHQNASSTAANRLNMLSLTTQNLTNSGSACFEYVTGTGWHEQFHGGTQYSSLRTTTSFISDGSGSIATTFSVNGNTTLGDATTDTVTATGPLTALRITPDTQLFDHTRGTEFFDDFWEAPFHYVSFGSSNIIPSQSWTGEGNVAAQGYAYNGGNGHPGAVLVQALADSTITTITSGGGFASVNGRFVQGFITGNGAEGGTWWAGYGAAKGAIEFQVYDDGLTVTSPPIDDSDSFTVTVGMFDWVTSSGATGSKPEDGIFCYAGSASANWQVCTCKAATCTCSDTSPAVSITENDWTRCEWSVNAAGTSVTFTVTDSGASGTATSTTNIPNDQDHPVGLGASVDRVDTTGFGAIMVDYAWFDQTFTTAR